MFSIAFSKIAFDQFKRICSLFPESKSELIRSLQEVRELLSRDPLGSSESRQNRDRICIVSPLTFYFTIDFQQSTIEISQVFYSRKA